MKIKKNFSPKDEKLNVFVPFVNLLLFEKLESPKFDSENEKLTENFLEAKEKIDENVIGESDYFNLKFIHFIRGLNTSRRQKIFDVIVENELFISLVSIPDILDFELSMYEESFLINLEQNFQDLEEFKDEAKMSRVVFYFFIAYFEKIFDVKCADKASISSMEYRNLIENLSLASLNIG